MREKRIFKLSVIFALATMLALSSIFVNVNSVYADSMNTFDEVPYWRFDASGEEQKITLKTDNLPRNLSFAGFSGDTVSRSNNASNRTDENIGAPSDSYYNDGFLEYTINFEGNAILIPAEPISYKKILAGNEVTIDEPVNSKMQYAIEASNTKPSKFKWMLCENIITVPVTATYTYKQMEYVKLTDGLKYDFVIGTKAPEAASTSWTHYLEDTPLDALDRYMSRTHITNYVSDHLQINDILIYKNYPVEITEKTIVFTDYIDFYIIDTNNIKDKGENTDVHLRNLAHPKYVTENYSFINEKSSLKVKYKVSDGFTVSGLAKGKEWIGWVGNNNPLLVQNGGDRALLWKTKSETAWHLTFPDTINEDIPIDEYMTDGTTLYFMDANCSTKLVTVKIPKRNKMPELSLNVDGFDSIISTLKPGVTMFRAYVLGDDGSINYISVPETLAKAETDNWYLFKGTEEHKKEFTLNELLGLVNNKETQAIPGIFLEAKTMGTKTKAESLVSVFYVNGQNEFGSWASNNDHVKVSLNGSILEISDADSANVYEYIIEGSTKWNKVTKSKVVDAKITSDSVVLVRKASTKTSDKTILLPSTYIEIKNGESREFAPIVPTP